MLEISLLYFARSKVYLTCEKGMLPESRLKKFVAANKSTKDWGFWLLSAFGSELVNLPTAECVIVSIGLLDSVSSIIIIGIIPFQSLENPSTTYFCPILSVS